VESGWDDQVSMDLGSSEQKTIRRVSINYITRHFLISSPQFDIGDGSCPEGDYFWRWSRIL